MYVGQIRYSPLYWEDLRIPLTAAQAGTNPPTLAQLVNDGGVSTGVYAWKFSNAVTEELFLWTQMPHGWREGTDIYPHIHWCAETAAAGNVVWALEYTLADSDGGAVFPATTTLSVTVPTTAAALVALRANWASISMVGQSISTLIGCRIYRDTGNPADNYGAKACGLDVDFHYQLDTPGSRQPLTK